MRRSRWRVLPVALATMLVAAATACSESDDVSIASPTSVDGATGDEPGTLLAADEVDVDDVAGEVWTVRYRSTSINGDPVEVSGLVAVPDSPPPDDGFPILSFGHGTTGIADPCAPAGPDGDFAAGFERFVEAGWVVALTDYEGLGTPGVHPYLVSESEGRSVLDAARTARNLVPGTGDRVVLSGHSQGGHASLAASEIAEEWAPELDVRGTIAVAPAADVRFILEQSLEQPVYQAFAVILGPAWTSVYDELDMTTILDDDGLALAERVTDDTCSQDLGAELRRSGATVVADESAALEPWRDRAEENSIDPLAVQGPVLVVQGVNDAILPPRLARELVAGLCAAEVDAELLEYGANHVGVYPAAEQDMLDWAADRLEGAPVQTSC